MGVKRTTRIFKLFKVNFFSYLISVPSMNENTEDCSEGSLYSDPDSPIKECKAKDKDTTITLIKPQTKG